MKEERRIVLGFLLTTIGIFAVVCGLIGLSVNQPGSMDYRASEMTTALGSAAVIIGIVFSLLFYFCIKKDMPVMMDIIQDKLIIEKKQGGGKVKK